MSNEDDNKSYISKASRISAIRSVTQTQYTSKTVISKLEHELQEEKQARLQLERELQELRKISSEISTKLGIRSNK
jgi:predicted  nucleic acid-binding Zn-ribbon protein